MMHPEKTFSISTQQDLWFDVVERWMLERRTFEVFEVAENLKTGSETFLKMLCDRFDYQRTVKDLSHFLTPRLRPLR
jgi:hypothetical protein